MATETETETVGPRKTTPVSLRVVSERFGRVTLSGAGETRVTPIVSDHLVIAEPESVWGKVAWVGPIGYVSVMFIDAMSASVSVISRAHDNVAVRVREVRGSTQMIAVRRTD